MKHKRLKKTVHCPIITYKQSQHETQAYSNWSSLCEALNNILANLLLQVN